MQYILRIMHTVSVLVCFVAFWLRLILPISFRIMGSSLALGHIIAPIQFVLWCVSSCFDNYWFYPYTSGLLHWYSGNCMPLRQPWIIWLNIYHESTKNWWYNKIIKQNTIKMCTCFIQHTIGSLSLQGFWNKGPFCSHPLDSAWLGRTKLVTNMCILNSFGKQKI